ncbi:IS3 family transposase [Enterobacteriales bacterium SAP-6]|uniref:IS3 family transposase n=1 Tax=Acerihabitans arboris TaxID=2691583 RepID=A0A845SH94_9GAMM|nr:IS3 family transposase [Acerihabitans arboris]
MLNGAVKRLSGGESPLLHSDQGWQYQMPRWHRWLRNHGIVQSMSHRGVCLDNAAMESFFGTLKSECFYLKEYSSLHELKQDIVEYIDYYNHQRIREKLDGLSPVQYRLKEAA